ncbi:MAG: DUF817 domain-containing protein [Rhizobiales bacterium]|nr:DUF817 domain-containing protein [Hyphomicrobiales bacterium]
MTVAVSNPAAAKHWRLGLGEFLLFGIKQAWACLFGGLLLALIIATKLWWPVDAALARYDFLLIAAICIQFAFLLAKLETLDEARVILIFHVVGTVMEIFKTGMGSWQYPEDNLIRIGGVPLFSGFMYSAVGSYLSRVWRIFDLRFSRYPSNHWTVALCAAAYLNFFAHHYIWDFRYVLFALVFVVFSGARVHFVADQRYRSMPLVLGFALVTFFIWLAENVGTLGQIWIYPHQEQNWHMVSPAKFGSWFLLMLISFVLVSLVHKPRTQLEMVEANSKSGGYLNRRTSSRYVLLPVRTMKRSLPASRQALKRGPTSSS